MEKEGIEKDEIVAECLCDREQQQICEEMRHEVVVLVLWAEWKEMKKE